MKPGVSPSFVVNENANRIIASIYCFCDVYKLLRNKFEQNNQLRYSIELYDVFKAQMSIQIGQSFLNVFSPIQVQDSVADKWKTCKMVIYRPLRQK